MAINTLVLTMFFKPSNQFDSCPPSIIYQNKTYTKFEDMTFITVPRPFAKGDIFERNKLAIHSWLSISNSSRIILFVNRKEFDPSGRFPALLDELYGAHRIRYAGPIRGDHKGVPYIDDWFIKGLKAVESKYVCFINSDIVLSSKWLRRVKQVYSVMNDKQLVLIGQRIDFDLQPEKLNSLHFGSKDFLKEIDEFVMSSNHSDHSPYGVDTFTFRADDPPFDPEKIPPFIMGRYNWDNWLVGWLNANEKIETITFNLSPPIYHVNHRRHNFDIKDDRVAINHHMKKVNQDYFGSNYDTKWEIFDDKLVHRYDPISYSLPEINDD